MTCHGCCHLIKVLRYLGWRETCNRYHRSSETRCVDWKPLTRNDKSNTLSSMEIGNAQTNR